MSKLSDGILTFIEDAADGNGIMADQLSIGVYIIDSGFVDSISKGIKSKWEYSTKVFPFYLANSSHDRSTLALDICSK